MKIGCKAVGMAGLAAFLGGCQPLWGDEGSDCELNLTCDHHRSPGNASRMPPGCVPSENAGPVSDLCGVFVSVRGDDANAATKGAPVKTLAAAIAAAEQGGTQRVYACAETFDEAVAATGSMAIYGGLDCTAGWTWAGTTTKTRVTAAEGEIPFVLRGEGANAIMRLEDFKMQARSAGPMTKPGTSSIAALAENVRLELARCVLAAGDAADGEDSPPESTSALDGENGNPGRPPCSSSVVFGAREQGNDCNTPEDRSDDSIGGQGGLSVDLGGGAGDSGRHGYTPSNYGTGESTAPCTYGTAGGDGLAGEPGAGASGRGEIALSGYSGGRGGDGTHGKTGRGGGGGGGAKGGTGAGRCMSATSAGGASGGSGGAGGCGGKGGRGGGAGGASIALISLDATLRFEGVTLTTGRGGTGGDGGVGERGGQGGAGGAGGRPPAWLTSLHRACGGGHGGHGGNGGRAGGGLGGHAIGIAFRGVEPALQGATIALGEAGPGGEGADAAHSGAAGLKADVQEF